MTLKVINNVKSIEKPSNNKIIADVIKSLRGLLKETDLKISNLAVVLSADDDSTLLVTQSLIPFSIVGIVGSLEIVKSALLNDIGDDYYEE